MGQSEGVRAQPWRQWMLPGGAEQDDLRTLRGWQSCGKAFLNHELVSARDDYGVAVGLALSGADCDGVDDSDDVD